MQTIAMIVAELIASGELVNPHEMAESRGGAALPMRLGGLRLNPGLAVAPALLHEPSVVIRRIVAEDPRPRSGGCATLSRRCAGHRRSWSATSGLGAGEQREILEAYRMFAHDRGWLARMPEAMRSGLTAEAAVQKVQDETRSRMMQATDPYLRERLLRSRGPRQPAAAAVLSGRGAARGRVARRNSSWSPQRWGRPSCSDYRASRIKGLVLEEGSPTQHVAIVARALDIPMVGRVDGAMACRRAGRPACRRWRQRQCAGSPARRYPAIGRGSGRGADPAARRTTRRCATSRP